MYTLSVKYQMLNFKCPLIYSNQTKYNMYVDFIYFMVKKSDYSQYIRRQLN